MTESLSSQVRQTVQRILPTVTVAGVLYGVLIGCLCAIVPGSWALAEGWYAIDDSVNVVITLRGTHVLTGTQTDIVLVLDRSGSMNSPIDNKTSNSKIAALKDAAAKFVSIVDGGTDGLSDEFIANNNRVGIVSFSDTVHVGSELTTSAKSVLAAVEGLTAQGSTAIGTGISAARSILTDTQEDRNRVMIVFTDGQENNNSDPSGQARNAKELDQTTIFSIGFGPDVDYEKLRDWASGSEEMKDQYAYRAYTKKGLDQIFELIGARMIEPAAKEVRLVEKVTDGFVISAPAVRGDPGSNDSITITNKVTPEQNLITWEPGTLNTGAMTLTYRVDARNRAVGELHDLYTSITYFEGTCSDISSIWLPGRIRTLIEFRSKHECGTQ